MTLVTQARSGEGDAMQYQIIEEQYGPDIRLNDWRVTRGDLATDHVFHQTREVWRAEGDGIDALFSAGGSLQIYATEPATVTRQNSIYGGGGDVEFRIRFEVERFDASGSFSVRFNDTRTGSGAASEKGFRVTVTPDGATFYYRTREIAKTTLSAKRGVTHELVFATLADMYLLRLNGEPVASGHLERHSQDNEGWVHLDVTNAGVRILEFQENFIVHDLEFPEWRKQELLYEESFGQESWKSSWVVNGESPEVAADFFIFRPMSNVILNRRFDGPIAVEIEATPMPSDEVSAGVTDAIFFWMMDKPDGDLAEYMRALPDAEREHYMDLPFYWMDFGGTNNVTTRQRRSPNLRMVRQFTDPDRLLKRDRTYRITLVQNETTFEFWVDGEPWIKAHDPEPLQSGYIGHRSFSSELKISGIQIWRIGE